MFIFANECSSDGMVDMPHSKCGAEKREGSSPFLSTKVH